MNTQLPLHPFARHPRTGEPIRAVCIDKNGRARYPIMGAGPEEDAAAEKVAADAAAEEAVTAAAAAKTDADTAAAKEAEGAAKDLGFPKDTPVAEMKANEQTAYWKHQAKKHETRATEWQTAAGGKTAAEVKAERGELETLRQSQLTDSEKALETAKAEGRAEASAEYAPRMARLAFETALAHVDDDAREILIDSLDLTKVITDSGDIDTAKVKTIAGTLAPADKESGRQRDYGAGRRESATKSGVAAGSDMYVASRSKSSTTTQ